MSADNYLYVRKLDNGKYDITDRSASSYYADDFPDGANLPKEEVDWIAPTPPPQDVQYDTLEQAVMAAHKELAEAPYPIEYGVSIQGGLI